MPVDEKTNSLRSVLENKSTEELKELLALDFSEQEDAEPNVEYIMTILEVIHEREGDTLEKQAQVTAAWNEFQETIQEKTQANAQAESPMETGTTEKPSLDHPCKTEYGQAFRKKRHALRYGVVAAALVVLLCGSACAIHWNIFQALADWTVETFGFLGRDQLEVIVEDDPFENMRLEVVKRSNVPAVPTWAPEGTEQSGEIEIIEKSRKVNIRGAFLKGEQEFSVWISIYHTVPDGYTTTYQKDDAAVQVYEVAGVAHYIVENYENVNVMWTNGYVEGHIQGYLSVEEVQEMIDSIYKE